MKLLIDSYKPINLDDLDFSSEVNQKLKKLAKIDNLPHLLLNGKYGSGKKLRALLFLKEKFGDFKISNAILSSSYNSETMNMLVSPYHHQFDLSIHNMHDRILLQTFIDEVVKYKSINHIPYRIVILENADRLTMEAQQSLRRTLETKIENCRFIFLVNKVNLLIEPLYSRCVKINCPSPTNLEIQGIIVKLLQRLNITMDSKYLSDLILASNRNLNLALHYTDRSIQLNLLNLSKFSLNTVDEIELTISQLVKLIISGQNLQIFSEEFTDKTKTSVRKYLYDLIVHNVHVTEILYKIFINVLQQIPKSEYKYIHELCCLTSKYDNSIRMSNKVMYHLEGYLLSLFKLIKTMIQNRKRESSSRTSRTTCETTKSPLPPPSGQAPNPYP